MTWSKEAERISQDFMNGTIYNLRTSLDELLTDISKVKKTKEELQSLKDIEEKVSLYKRDFFHLNDEETSQTKDAFKEIMFIDERVKAKKELFEEKLEKQIFSFYEESDKVFSSSNIDQLQRKRKEVAIVKSYAQLCDYQGLLQKASVLEELTDKRINQVIEQENTAKENDFFYDAILTDAKKGLKENKSVRKLRHTRDELLEASLSYDGNNKKDDLDALIHQYDTIISQKNKVRRNRGAKNLAIAFTLGTILSIGYSGFSQMQESTNKKRQEIKREQLAKIKELKNVEKEYVAKIKALEKSYDNITTALERKNAELNNVKKKVVRKESASNTQIASFFSSTKKDVVRPYENLISRLSPVLNNKTFTLYIEKEENKTFLVEKQGVHKYKVHGPFKHTDAVNPLPKTTTGQMRTPEGVYTIISEKYFGDEKVAPFGRGFYKINYPNAVEKALGYTGDGVGFCSAKDEIVNQAISLGDDVMHSGIAFSDEVFENIRSIIGNGEHTQVVIENYALRPLEVLGK